ncbi:MAG: YdjY domain-containing protein [Planctomycetes bacterium]|nr:YdjY domain-containing protein [Planctomycetota bacterium]
MILFPAILVCSLHLQEPVPSSAETPAAKEAVIAALAAEGVRVDQAKGLLEVSGAVCQTRDPLEYLIVTPRGKDHEALFKLEEGITGAALNTAMLLLGVEKGENGRMIPKNPPPTREEYEAGAPLHDVEHASGDGFYITVGWELPMWNRTAERFMFRVEDLVLNVNREATYQRGKFVYLGSRFIRAHKDAPELFAADAEGNLVSLVYFHPANHLLTGSDPQADNQYIWFPNHWILPEINTPVTLWFSREPLERWPELSESLLPKES